MHRSAKSVAIMLERHIAELLYGCNCVDGGEVSQVIRLRTTHLWLEFTNICIFLLGLVFFLIQGVILPLPGVLHSFVFLHGTARIRNSMVNFDILFDA